MATALDRTCWRGLKVDHPPHWEIARASDRDQPGRCTFSDRHYHRLDLQWRKVDYVPNLELMLEKYRLGDKGEQRNLSPLPTVGPWRGLLRKTDEGHVTHAMRAFAPQRLQVEATMVWPDRRDEQLEAAILASVAVDDGQERLWQAMGISLSLSGQFDLRENTSKVGKVAWEFATSDKRGPVLTVERVAMPEFWLKGTLREWLVHELPLRAEVVRQDAIPFNAHRADQIVSRSSISAFRTLQGIRQARLELTWLCPVENRVYHVIVTQPRRDEELSIPPSLTIRCCRPYQPAGKELLASS
jgi:hypothetical protein